MMDNFDELSAFEPNFDPAQNLKVEIQLECGFKIEGVVPQALLKRLFRDPSNLDSVVDELPAGTAVSVVLPPSIVQKYSVGAP